MKLTPLNITLACVLVWFISELSAEREWGVSYVWLFLFVVLLAVLDLVFRLIFRETKKLWFGQIGFILVVSILMVLLKLI